MSQYYARARQIAEEEGLDPSVGEALIWQESRGNPRAISPVGAIGLGQIMPKTGAGYGYTPEQLMDPETNLRLSMKIAANNVRNYGLENGLAAYNGGEGRLKKSGYNLANMPPETRGFVPSILNRAAQLNGGEQVADRVAILPRSIQGFTNPEVVVNNGLQDGHFKSQNIREKNPEALAAIQDYKDTQRAMLPMALASMMSSNRGQQNFGNRLYAEAAGGINPMKLANGYVMDDGTYITDQDPSALIRAQAALQSEINEANQVGVLGGGSVTQIGATPEGLPIFKGKAPTPFIYNEQGQAVPYTGGVGSKTAVNPTEDENKAIGYYDRIKNGIQTFNESRAESPNVATQSVIPRYVEKVPLVGADAANLLTSEGRRTVEATQRDVVDAILTLGTGAAYTKQQFENAIRAYFPQPGDDDKAIENKNHLLQVQLQSAKDRAGRALQKRNAGSGQTPGIGAGPGPAANDLDDPLGVRRR